MSPRSALAVALALALGVAASSWAGFQGSQGGAGNASRRDFGIEVARGKITGFSHTNKFGENTAVDTNTDPEDIWGGGGLYVPPTSAMIHSVVSTSTADDAGSTGALTLTIQGLGSSWEAISETVTLDGQTPVATSNAYLRINRMWVATCGSGGVNAGAISATMRNDPVTVSAIVGAANGQTLMAVYSLADGCTGFVSAVRTSIVRNSNANNTADFRLYARQNLDASPSLRVKDSWSCSVNGQTNVEYRYSPPKVISGPADVFLRCENVSSSSTRVSGSFDLIEVADTAE